MKQEINKIRIVIADDHVIFRQGFITMVRKKEGLEVVGGAADGVELIELVKKQSPDIAFVDIMMPNMDGIAATKLIRESFPSTRVIALSMFNDDNLVVDMLEAGASGYLLKNTSVEELLIAIDVVYNGEEYFCADTSRRLVKLLAKSSWGSGKKIENIKFSEREKEVVQLMCEQLTIKEIADKLGISPRTVENYRETLQEKTGSKNAIGVVLYAIRNKMVAF